MLVRNSNCHDHIIESIFLISKILTSVLAVSNTMNKNHKLKYGMLYVICGCKSVTVEKILMLESFIITMQELQNPNQKEKSYQ